MTRWMRVKIITSRKGWSPRAPLVGDRILGSFATDAAVLKFTDYCVNSQLEMEIQFGSEEYNEYISHQLIAGSDFHNDAFLITVDGVPISPLPDATDIIAANTVHPLITEPECPLSTQIIGNLEMSTCLWITLLSYPTTPRVEYDGLTVRLRLHAFVQSGQNHQIRIAIADTDDEKLDSALFIKQSSIRAINPN